MAGTCIQHKKILRQLGWVSDKDKISKDSRMRECLTIIVVPPSDDLIKKLPTSTGIC